MVEAGLGLDVEIEAGSALSATYLVAIYDAGTTGDACASGAMPVDIALHYVELAGWYVAVGAALLSSPGEASDAEGVVSSGSGDMAQIT